jgi:methionyl-tRNA formyltransferase
MNNRINIIFFGSTTDSIIVLEKLLQIAIRNSQFVISYIVTQPPKPVGRKQIITPTPVELWAKKHAIPVLTFPTSAEKPWQFQNEDTVTNTLSTFKPTLLISACYGVKIPFALIKQCDYGGLNIHPSLLPRFRGAYPVPWTILSGDAQTGVTIVTLSERFDQGRIIAQKKQRVGESETSEILRKELFILGADLLVKTFPDYISGKNKGVPQKAADTTYARKLTRDDGYIPWNVLQQAMEGTTTTQQCSNVTIVEYLKKMKIFLQKDCTVCVWILRMMRALSPWPGVWTLLRPLDSARGFGGQALNEEKRLKILAAHEENGKLVIDTVQVEGGKPILFKQFENVYF